MNLNLKNGQSKTITLNTIIKGPSSYKDGHKALVLGFANYNIDISDKLSLDFNESDYNAQVRVLFKKENDIEYIEKVNVFSTKNGLMPIDVTNRAKNIQYFQTSVVQEYLIK